MTDAIAAPTLLDLAARVAGPGGDPARLVGVVAWLAARGRSADALRRACLDPQVRLGQGRAPLPEDPAALDAVLGAGPSVDDPAIGAAVRDALAAWSDRDVRVATAGDGGYPARLAANWPHRDVPPLVAHRGSAHPDGPSVAIVGARRATGYGRSIAAWLAAAASSAGVRVISGGARGIDAAAHHAALEGPGGTTVVLGCGHGVGYPAEHANPDGLFDRILRAGGTLCSEQLPHVRPHAGNVRARNRVVAALADAVVVVEGGQRSGSLVTATAAADHDVAVLAVPGDVRAPGSAAPHRLLAEGAAPCTSPADLLAALSVPAPSGTSERTPAPAASVLPDDVRAELAAAWPRPRRVDELAERTGRPTPSLLAVLTRARVAGELAEDASGVRLRRAPPDG